MSEENPSTLQDILISEKQQNVSPVTSNTRSTYSSTKGAALGMMDLALLTANANQLRFLMVYNETSHTYYVSFVLLILSLVMQVCVGIALIFKQDMKSKGRRENLNIVNKIIVGGIFLITVINVIAAAFTVTDPAHK